MAKLGEMLQSKYLKKDDVEDDMVVTIVGTKKANIAMDDQEPDIKWLVKFKELEKPLVLNSTNTQLIFKATGTDDTDDWVGKQVKLYVDENVSFGGKLVGGIRVRVPRQKAEATASGTKFEDFKDDIPW